MLLQAVNFTGYHLIRRTLLCGISQHCMACLESGLLSLRKFKLLGIIIGSLSKDDSDGNMRTTKNAVGLDCKTTILQVSCYVVHFFAVSAQPQYDVKLPYFTFYEGCEHRTTISFSFC